MGLMAFEVKITPLVRSKAPPVEFFFLSQRDRIAPLLSLWEKTG